MLKCQKKWLELFLKKFLLCTFRNNVESETVLYLTNGRKIRRLKLQTSLVEQIKIICLQEGRGFQQAILLVMELLLLQ